MGVKIRTSRAQPCIFCGDVGYDMRVIYDEGDEVYWCHKAHAAKGEIVSIPGGESFICISSEKQIEIGTFCLFKKYLSKEEWMAKKAATDPNWNRYGATVGKSVAPRTVRNICDTISTGVGGEQLLKNESKVLSPKQLDAIYRYMLSLLVLEDKHMELLKQEWDVELFPWLRGYLLKEWPIKSLSPLDKVRYAQKERFRNPSRKSIVAQLIKKFGSLEGVPGFYERTGEYWDSKPVEERWTFAFGEGIIFPCFDKDGYLYRIRFRDDYPSYRVKPGKEEFMGDSGYFHHSYNQNGEHVWQWYPDSDKTHPIVVYGEGKSLISLKKGCPTIGKVSGKYKNFSSVSGKYDAATGVSFNKLYKGSRSGSPYSLYDKDVSSWKVVLGTEGEKKSMVANALKKLPVVSVPGVWCYNCLFEGQESVISYLKKKGMRVFVLCYDADKDDNQDVSNAEKAFIAALEKEGIMVLKGEWSSSFDKGLDDILLMGLEFKMKHP